MHGSSTIEDAAGVVLSRAEDVAHAADDLLIERARSGEDEAFAELYRRHAFGALRLARTLGQREEAEDVVAESFARLLELLRRGQGPDEAFRAYLYTTIRHEAGHRVKIGRRVRLVDDQAVIDSATGGDDGGFEDFESSAALAAYESLPERWRSVLWQLDVEGRKPHDIADELDLSPNGVSALVYRARSALRDAYVQQHVNAHASGDDVHLDIRSRLGAVLRDTAAPRDRRRVHEHLEGCAPCRAVYLELEVDVGHVVA
ncbi:MAG: sigma-70 family RNA polymerase sigma factor [Aeromicrobium sp.]